MRWMRAGGVVALVIGVVLALWLTLRQFGGGKPAPAPATAGAGAGHDGVLGAPPPEAIRSSARAARHHVEQQNCLANCAAEVRTCEATAEDTESEQRCRQQARACEAECR